MVMMSQKEFQRVKVIENAVAGRLSVGEAARLLQLSERQVQRLKRRYRPDDVDWVHHGNRGRLMPWALPAALRRTILELARGNKPGTDGTFTYFSTPETGERPVCPHVSPPTFPPTRGPGR
jgi:transposase